MLSLVSTAWGKSVAFVRISCSLFADRISRAVHTLLSFARQPVNNYVFSPITSPFYVPFCPHHFSKNQSVISHFFTVSTMTTISTANLNLLER